MVVLRPCEAVSFDIVSDVVPIAMATISDRARDLAAGPSSDPVDLAVLLRRDLDPRAIGAVVDRIRGLADSPDHVDFLEPMGIVLCRAAPQMALVLAELDDIEWVDLESTAEAEELIDE